MEQILEVNGLSVPQDTSVIERPRKVREFAEEVHRSAENFNDRARIALGAAWKEIRDEAYWESYGFKSFDDYIFQTYNVGKASSNSIIGIYETYVMKLKVPPLEIAGISWFALREIKPFVTEENVAKFIEKVRGMSQKEVRAWAKELKGLHPAESESPKGKRFIFNLEDSEQSEVIALALKTAETTVESPVPSIQLEAICAEYLTNNLEEDSPEEKLIKIVSRLERIFNVKISWEKNNEG